MSWLISSRSGSYRIIKGLTPSRSDLELKSFMTPAMTNCRGPSAKILVPGAVEGSRPSRLTRVSFTMTEPESWARKSLPLTILIPMVLMKCSSEDRFA